jgi:hypothetical protein
MIRLLQGFPNDVLAIAGADQVTGRDYRDVLIPAVNAALAQHPKLRVYYEITPTFSGIDAAAVWEDCRVGIMYWSRWRRMAVVTDAGWVRRAVQAFRFLMPGRLRVFPGHEAAAARRWLLDE